MKKLFLMRHAKSDWNDRNLSDFDRPLNDRGIRNAPEMGKRLLDKWGVPEKIYCSSARRTVENCHIYLSSHRSQLGSSRTTQRHVSRFCLRT